MGSFVPQVLVIDDIAAIVDELLTLLELNGIAAVGARSLSEATASLELHPSVTVIACDVRLDRESGIDIVEQIDRNAKLDGRKFRYIFISGDPMQGSGPLRGSGESGGLLMLTKPIDPRNLIELLCDLLDQDQDE